MTFHILDDGNTVLNAEEPDLDQWMEEAFEIRLKRFGKDLLCYSPTAYPYQIDDHKQRSSENFVSLSVTGTACSLNCEHCSGHLLKGMEATVSPESLYERCRQIAEAGGEGVLISGGSDSEGHVPLTRFVEVIGQVKRDFQLAVVVHTGLVDEETALLLAKARVDAAMLDVIGDESVAERVYHLKDAPRKMLRSLQILEETGVPTVPHVLIGLDYGHLNGELEALDLISKGSPAALVLIALNPLRKTPMEGVAPPSPEDIG
ncbi:radical SAM protein, partial [Candidatus Thorarchaeota archaeon]